VGFGGGVGVVLIGGWGGASRCWSVRGVVHMGWDGGGVGVGLLGCFCLGVVGVWLGLGRPRWGGGCVCVCRWIGYSTGVPFGVC